MLTITGVEMAPGGTTAPSLYDIGWSLSQVPRFGGHTRYPWSNLQHLFLCYRYAADKQMDTYTQLYALLHDAHEAITGDIPHPWKTRDMKIYQAEIDRRLFDSLSIPLPYDAIYDQVKKIDRLALSVEADLFGPAAFPLPAERNAVMYQLATEIESIFKSIDTHQRANFFVSTATTLIRRYNESQPSVR